MSSSLKRRYHTVLTVAGLSPLLLLPNLAQAQAEDPSATPSAAAPAGEAAMPAGEAAAPASEAAAPASEAPPRPEATVATTEPTEAAPPSPPSDPPPPSTDTTPKMDLSAPPPPPARTRKARVHNGFYLRGGFGAGGMWPKLSDHSEGERFDMKGGSVALSFDAMVGGSPADGFALGGGVSWLGGTSDVSGGGADATVSLLTVGPFFDAFPEPKDGFHLGAMAGFAMHRISGHPSNVDSALGFGGSAWLGYDWWVSDEISAGLMLRLNGALTSGDEGAGSLKANTMGLTVLATALYH